MAKYHISASGAPALCKAQARPCPLGGEEVHGDFPTAEAARSWAEEKLADAYGAQQPSLSKSSSEASTAPLLLHYTDIQVGDQVTLPDGVVFVVDSKSKDGIAGESSDGRRWGLNKYSAKKLGPVSVVAAKPGTTPPGFDRNKPLSETKKEKFERAMADYNIAKEAFYDQMKITRKLEEEGEDKYSLTSLEEGLKFYQLQAKWLETGFKAQQATPALHKLRHPLDTPYYSYGTLENVRKDVANYEEAVELRKRMNAMSGDELVNASTRLVELMLPAGRINN